MNNKHLELLHRSFDQKLSDQDQNELTKALDQSPKLRAEKESMALLQAQVKAGAAASFKPFFAERVMAQINIGESAVPGLLGSLVPTFRPVLVAGALAILLLALMNLGSIDYSILAQPEQQQTSTIDEFVSEATVVLLEEAL